MSRTYVRAPKERIYIAAINQQKDCLAHSIRLYALHIHFVWRAFYTRLRLTWQMQRQSNKAVGKFT